MIEERKYSYLHIIRTSIYYNLFETASLSTGNTFYRDLRASRRGWLVSSQEAEKMTTTDNPTVLFQPFGELRGKILSLCVCLFSFLFLFFQERVFSLIHGWPSLCFLFPWCSAKCSERCDKTDPLLENEKRKIKKLHTLDNPVKKVFCLYHWEPLLKLNYLLSVVITTLSINI